MRNHIRYPKREPEIKKKKVNIAETREFGRTLEAYRLLQSVALPKTHPAALLKKKKKP